MDGKGDVVSGWYNKLQPAIASIIPRGVLTEQHRKMAAPGTVRSLCTPTVEVDICQRMPCGRALPIVDRS